MPSLAALVPCFVCDTPVRVGAVVKIENGRAVRVRGLAVVCETCWRKPEVQAKIDALPEEEKA